MTERLSTEALDALIAEHENWCGRFHSGDMSAPCTAYLLAGELRDARLAGSVIIALIAERDALLEDIKERDRTYLAVQQADGLEREKVEAERDALRTALIRLAQDLAEYVIEQKSIPFAITARAMRVLGALAHYEEGRTP